MSTANQAEQFVNEEVPSVIRHLIPSALRRAYAAADLTIDRHDYLSTPGGKYQRGDLIMLAASFELDQLVRRGDLPFDGTWEFFAKPTGKHFVMLSKRARITTNQVEDPSKKPRRAVFRSNYEELNDLFLLPEFNEELRAKKDEAERNRERRSLHILHGYQSLNFAYVAYPHPEKNRHIYRSENLMDRPSELAGDLPPPEGPTDSPNPEALEGLERHLRDNE